MLTLATWQLSAVVGVPNVTPVAVQAVLVVVEMSAGQLMVGLMLSVTVTFWVQVAVLPASSVTVHVTIVSPKS